MELTLEQALQKGIEAHKTGKVKEADQYYTAILQAQPKHPDANHNMGVLAVGVGKVDQALPFLKTALEANPSIEQFWLSYIDALIKLEQLADAKAVLDQAKNTGVKGDAFDQLEKRLGSSEAKNSTTQDPPQNQQQSVINLHSQGKYQQALKQAKTLLKQFPNSSVLYNICGACSKGLGQFDDAIEAYNKAIAIKPDYSEAYNNMGMALGNQGEHEESIEAYKKALSIKPDYADAYSNIGNALQEQGKLEEATEAFDNALSIKPDFADAHYNRGNALKDQGKLEEAIEAYTKATALKPDYAEAYNNIGFVRHDQGKLEEAIEAYNKAIFLRPDYGKVWNNSFLPLQAMKMRISSPKDLKLFYPKDINSKHAKVELGILDYRLHRGQEKEDHYLDQALSLLSSADDIVIQNPKSDNNSNDQIKSLPDKMVALVHFGRSGTGLLHSLIDGHSEVSTLPSIYFSEYFDHSTWMKIISNGWDGVIDRFMEIYDVLFDASSAVPIIAKSIQMLQNIGVKEGMANVGDQRDEVLRVDRKLFRAELGRLINSYDKLDAFSFFKLVNAAYDKAISDLNPKNLIFYHIHNPDTYAQLNFFRLAPQAKWIMMVREPIQSLESWANREKEKNWYSKISNNILSMLFEIDNIIYHKQDSVAVRLEDLKERPRKTIPALCKWMGIKEEDSLYEMTAQGKKWCGDPNSPDYEKDGNEPFGKTSINRKVGTIFSENDQFILRTLFYPFSVSFGYTEENEEQFKVDLQKIRPMIDEMFDFEIKIAEKVQMSSDRLIGSGSYLYFRSVLVERWNTLNKYKTYPNMINPLKIESESIG